MYKAASTPSGGQRGAGKSQACHSGTFVAFGNTASHILLLASEARLKSKREKCPLPPPVEYAALKAASFGSGRLNPAASTGLSKQRRQRPCAL